MTIPKNASPLVADIIRWAEPVWAPPHQKRGKPDKIGEQIVTAEVLAIGDSFELQVQAIEVLSLKDGVTESALKVKVGDRIRRKKSTIESGLIK